MKESQEQDDEDIQGKEREFEKLLIQEEMHWQQRARKQWLQAGDINTAFFHQCSKRRRNRNHIEKIVDEEGREWISPEDISRSFMNYYSELFSTMSLSWEIID